MTVGEQLALSRPWWMWLHKEIQNALRTAKLRHCLPLIDEALRRNRETGQSPQTFKALANPLLLDRNPRNLERIEDGTYALTDQHLLGLSVVLNIPVQKLQPPEVDWLQEATCELCGQSVSAPEARVYVLYRLAHRAHPSEANCSLDLGAVREVWGDMNQVLASEQDVERAVLKVVSALGKVLERCEEKAK